MAVVALVSLSQGLQNAVLSEFNKIGADRIIVTPGGAKLGPVGGMLSASKFTEDDYDALKKVKGIDTSASVYTKTAYITYGKETKQEQVWGFPIDSEHMEFYRTQSMFDIDKGRLLRPGDKNKVMIGWETANEVFDKKIKVGNKIRINGQEFEVVGIHTKQGGLLGAMGDKVIRIPKETAREIFHEPDEITSIFLRVKNPEDIDQVVESVKHRLRRFRHVKEGEEDFTVQTSKQVIQTFNNILGIVQAVLVGLALISLLVGGIGIMNTMYTAVAERTKEIGIMKSVGAKNSAIRWIFMIESGLLGTVGGIIGMIIGLGIGKMAEMVALQYGIESLKAYMGLPLLIGAILFSFVVGALAGTLPAMRAARLKPVDALRK